MNDNQFLKSIGTKIGSGFQGDVHNFGTNLVVKIWRKDNNDNEIKNSIIAGKHNCGPRIYEHRIINDISYMVMEKIVPVEISEDDFEDVIDLFNDLVDIKLVNLDGSFGRRKKHGKLLLYDYGVSEIVPTKKEAIKYYCEYFDTFRDFYDLNVYPYFC
jgi:hypothetical protein